MNKIDLIFENVQKEITENTIMVEFAIDINNIAPFMCSPFIEGWIWSEKTTDLNSYLYQMLIPGYLINVLVAHDSEIIDNRIYSFSEAVSLYLNSELMNNIRIDAINTLKQMYEDYNEKEITYLEFIKMVIKLEDVLIILDIDFKGICYVNPFEARFSNSLKTRKFDYVNLSNNFQ